MTGHASCPSDRERMLCGPGFWFRWLACATCGDVRQHSWPLLTQPFSPSLLHALLFPHFRGTKEANFLWALLFRPKLKIEWIYKKIFVANIWLRQPRPTGNLGVGQSLGWESLYKNLASPPPPSPLPPQYPYLIILQYNQRTYHY